MRFKEKNDEYLRGWLIEKTQNSRKHLYWGVEGEIASSSEAGHYKPVFEYEGSLTFITKLWDDSLISDLTRSLQHKIFTFVTLVDPLQE